MPNDSDNKCPMCGKQYSNREQGVKRGWIEGVRDDANVCERKRHAAVTGLQKEYTVWVHVP